MPKKLNKDLYSDQLFSVWSSKEDLLPIEKYFLEKYLVKQALVAVE